MAIANGADGFTDYQSTGTVYYVAAGGSNGNSGTSESSPFATIAHAYSQVTGGTGAKILLRRGQTFSLADLAWGKSGASSTDFMVLGAYGPLTDARPIVNVGGSQAIAVHDTTLRYVAFQNLDFRAAGGSYALSFLFVNQGASKALEHIHVEGCRFFQFYRGIRWQTDEPSGGVIPANPTPATNCKMRRNVFEFCGIGFYSSMLHTADIHDNIYLGCGTNYQDHGCYFDDSRYTGSQPDIDYRRNIAMGDDRGCGEGHKIRCVSNSGNITDNFAARCGIGISAGSGGETHGGGTGMDPWYALRANVTDNWITEGVNQKNFDGSVKPMGQGIWLIWLSGTSSDVQRNIVTDMGGNYRAGITITNGPSNGVNISNNTCYQAGGSGGAALYSLQNGTTITNMVVSNNKFRDSTNTALIVQDVPGTLVPAVRGGNTLFSLASNAGMVVNAGTLADYGTKSPSISDRFTGVKPTITTFLASIGITGDYTTLRNMLALQRQGAWDTRIEATRINDHARAWAGYPALATGAANVPPTANAGPDVTVTDTDRNASVTATLDFTGSTDGDGTIATYVVRQGSTVLYSGSDNTPDVVLGLGLNTLTVTCIDDDGAASAADTVVITGKPGVPTGFANSAGPGSTTLSVTAYTGVTFEWRYGTSTGNYGAATPSVGRTFTVNGAGGSTTIYWQVRAIVAGVNGDWSAEQTATTGATDNAAPIASIGPFGSVSAFDENMDGVETVTLDGTASSDSDGTVTAWAWKEGGSTIATGSTATASMTIGRHSVDLVVTDNAAKVSAPLRFIVDVTPNPPTGVGSLPGGTLLYCQSYPNATGYEFNYGATTALGTTVTSPTPSITLPESNAVRYWTVKVLADKLSSLPTSIQRTIPSQTETHPPVANAGTDITDTDTDNNGFEAVTLDGSGSTDNGNDIVGWYWAQDGTVLSIDSETYALNAPVGVNAYTLTVIDSQGAISADSDEVVVSVTPARAASLTLIPGDTKLVAAWAIVNGDGVTYEIQANINSDFSGSPAAETTSTFNGSTIEGLANDTLYYVRVRAVCDGLNGAWSTSQSETPTARPDPSNPPRSFLTRKERLLRLLRIGRI